MEFLIKKVLLEYVQGMDEIDHTTHSKERITDRIMKPVDIPVQFVHYNGNRWVYERIGKFVMTDNVKNKILMSVDAILKYDIPEDENYAVILHHFDLSPSDIEYFDREDKYRTMKMYLQDYPEGMEPRFYLTVMDEFNKPSTGDYLIAILKTNKIVTIEYTNSVGMSSSKYKNSKIINVGDLERIGVKKGF